MTDEQLEAYIAWWDSLTPAQREEEFRMIREHAEANFRERYGNE